MVFVWGVCVWVMHRVCAFEVCVCVCVCGVRVCVGYVCVCVVGVCVWCVYGGVV